MSNADAETSSISKENDIENENILLNVGFDEMIDIIGSDSKINEESTALCEDMHIYMIYCTLTGGWEKYHKGGGRCTPCSPPAPRICEIPLVN